MYHPLINPAQIHSVELTPSIQSKAKFIQSVTATHKDLVSWAAGMSFLYNRQELDIFT